MVKSRSKGASKGKRYTRRHVKGGNNTPTLNSNDSVVGSLIPKSVKKSGTYGFGQNRSINQKPKTIWSKETGFGFTPPPVGDINVDNYNDATLFEDDDNATLFDSASKKSSKKISLPKTTSVWDGRVDYLKQREQYIETQNKTIKDLNNKITNLNANNPEEEKLLQELSINFTQMTDMVNNRKDNVPQNEKKATENLSNMFRDQINFLYFYKNAEQIIGQINKLRGITIKPPAKPWFNFTRKKVNKTGTQLLHKILRAATGANITQAGEIAQLLKKSGEQITNDAIKKVWADMLKKQKEA